MKTNNPKKQPSVKTKYSQMSDFQKTQFMLDNKTRLLDTERFIKEFKSFEEPAVDNFKV